MKKLNGTGVALVTPFKENLEVDYEALDRLVEFQISNKVEYLVLLGTTAETPTLTKEEQQLVVERIVKANRDRLPLVLGLGGNDTANLVHQIKHVDAKKFEAILSVSPYYNRPTQEGIYQHFKALASVSRLPILMYNIPYRTGTNMDPDTVFRLANEFENIAGIKEAAGNFDQVLILLQGKPGDFMVISGEDSLALPLVLAGGAGVISVMGQALPDFSEMIRLGLDQKTGQAFDMFYQILPGIQLIFKEGNPAGIKAMLNHLGICKPFVRLPLVKASPELQKKISNFVEIYK
jgi:4-hydroxy-tetrahydrodipicolinate synthase